MVGAIRRLQFARAGDDNVVTGFFIHAEVVLPRQAI